MRAAHGLLATLAVAAVLLAGCGDEEAAPDAGGHNVPGAPNNDAAAAQNNAEGPDVPVAPIGIPPLVQSRGGDIDIIRARAEASILEACQDGTMCVTVVVARGTADDLTTCQFFESDPPTQFLGEERVWIPRNSTLTLFTGANECTSTSPSGGSEVESPAESPPVDPVDPVDPVEPGDGEQPPPS